MLRIISVSSSRADVGILSPVWHELAETADVALHVFATGMHMAADAPELENLPSLAEVHRGGDDLGGADPGKAAAAMAAITMSAGALYSQLRPDMLLVIGDRLDMMPAAMAALPFNLPIVHLHGGEITQGAIDDRTRYAMTALAHIHCVSTEGARLQLIASGEEPWRIHVTGAPGLDTLRVAPELPATQFAEEIGLNDIKGLRLVTVHPETNSTHPEDPLDAVLIALEESPAPTLFTAPNSDPGGSEMKRRIKDFVANRDWAVFADTLGMRLYPNALRHAALMVGNSSSGIIEAGTFGLPVIDVGTRQKGREQGANVQGCPADAASIKRLMSELSGKRFDQADNPYGDEKSGVKVAAVLRGLPEQTNLLTKMFGSSSTPGVQH